MRRQKLKQLYLMMFIGWTSYAITSVIRSFNGYPIYDFEAYLPQCALAILALVEALENAGGNDE